MKWPLTCYVDQLPNDCGGMANGPVIRILKKYSNDEGLYKHELMHVKQWFATLSIHGLLYPLVRRYRQWAEVQAYREQMRWPNGSGGSMSAEQAAAFLSLPRYDLGITQADALKFFQQEQRP